MKLRAIIYSLLLLIVLSGSKSIANWSVLIYMEAPDLHDAAIHNITKLLKAQTNDNAHIAIQLHLPGETAYRYTAHHGSLHYEGQIHLQMDFEKDIADACAWAYKQPSHHHAFFFWGHGCGILIPTWDEEKNEWHFEHDDAFDLCDNCYRLPFSTHFSERHRGVILNDQTHQMVTNENMINITQHLHENILGKKLDILAIDCCLGAMVEHAYQLSDHVHYLVGCQNCELPDGYDYYGFGERISQDSCTPQTLVKGIVEDYGTYYEQHAPKGLYTLAGFDCSKAAEIKEKLDALVTHLFPELATQKKRRIALKKLLIKECLRFCWLPMYTDLYTMLSVINEAIELPAFDHMHEDTKDTVRTLISELRTTILEAVVHNVTGHKMEKAYGISIYLPYSHIDSSYQNTRFAQESKWMEFLRTLHT